MGCAPQNRVKKMPEINVKPTKISSSKAFQ